MIKTDRLVSLFCQMVSIDSESGNEAEFAEFIQNLAQKLGLKFSLDSYGNIYVTFPGEGEPLMLNTHMDTVVPGKNIKPRIENGYVQSDGTTVLGADSKAGIAAIFEAVKVIQEQGIKNRPISITLSCNEETGIPTAPFIQSEIKRAIVLDRGASLGQIIVEAPFAQVFQINITGKTAYATSNFNDGRHALLAGCQMVSDLPIGNFDQYSTSNIGLMQGGIMTTTIPENCFFKGNCYSFNEKSIKTFFKELERIVSRADKKFGTISEIQMLEYFGGYKINQADELVTFTQQAIRQAGLRPIFKTYKTVTNANNLNQIGIKTVLISTGVENQHTVNERIKVNSLEKLTQIVINLMQA